MIKRLKRNLLPAPLNPLDFVFPNKETQSAMERSYAAILVAQAALVKAGTARQEWDEVAVQEVEVDLQEVKAALQIACAALEEAELHGSKNDTASPKT